MEGKRLERKGLEGWKAKDWKDGRLEGWGKKLLFHSSISLHSHPSNPTLPFPASYV
jgi:hypothetical protein